MTFDDDKDYKGTVSDSSSYVIVVGTSIESEQLCDIAKVVKHMGDVDLIIDDDIEVYNHDNIDTLKNNLNRYIIKDSVDKNSIKPYNKFLPKPIGKQRRQKIYELQQRLTKI